MADGEGKDVYDVLMKLSNQVSRVETKVDGLVSHERMAEVINLSRTEWRGDIRAALEANANTMRTERRAEMSELEARIKSDTERRVADLEKRAMEREARDERIEARVRLTFIGVGVVGISGIAYALWNLMHGVG